MSAATATTAHCIESSSRGRRGEGGGGDDRDGLEGWRGPGGGGREGGSRGSVDGDAAETCATQLTGFAIPSGCFPLFLCVCFHLLGICTCLCQLLLFAPITVPIENRFPIGIALPVCTNLTILLK